MDKYQIGFRQQRQLILRQEQSHHDFGLRALAGRLQNGQVAAARIHDLTQDYLGLIRQVTEEMNDVFATLDEDAEEYHQDLIERLPDWLLSVEA